MTFKLSYLLSPFLPYGSSNVKDYFDRLTENIISLSWDRPCDEYIDPPTCADCPEFLDETCRYKLAESDNDQNQRFIPIPKYDLRDMHMPFKQFALSIQNSRFRTRLLGNLTYNNWFCAMGAIMSEAESNGIIPQDSFDALVYEEALSQLRCWAEGQGLGYEDDSKVISGISKVALAIFRSLLILNDLQVLNNTLLKLFAKNAQRYLARTASSA